MAIQKCEDLEIYNLSFSLAMDIFQETRTFPKEEKYSLVDQILRSSRSVPVNIREGFAKRRYPDVFSRHLNDALGSSEETLAWLEFSYKSNYMSQEKFKDFTDKYKHIGAMIYKLMKNWKEF